MPDAADVEERFFVRHGLGAVGAGGGDGLGDGVEDFAAHGEGVGTVFVEDDGCGPVAGYVEVLRSPESVDRFYEGGA